MVNLKEPIILLLFQYILSDIQYVYLFVIITFLSHLKWMKILNIKMHAQSIASTDTVTMNQSMHMV